MSRKSKCYAAALIYLHQDFSHLTLNGKFYLFKMGYN